jgi:nucleoside-diphosphate-sugar epimerase
MLELESTATPSRRQLPYTRAPSRVTTLPEFPSGAKLMKKILILGVNGFIGHHLSKRILATTDWDVYGMDMQSERVADLMGHPRFHFFEGDITINKEWIEYHIRKCDTVLPLVAIATPATYVKEPLRVFELDFEANLPIVRRA